MTEKNHKLIEKCRTIVIAGHRGDRGPVVDGLTDSEPKVRLVALGAACRLGLLDGPDLVRFLDDPDVNVRYRALELLPNSPDSSQATGAVINTMFDNDLAELAAFTLGELSLSDDQLVEAEAALRRQATSHSDALCRESAVAALGALGVGLDAILTACGDVATVRRRAVLALAPFDGPEVDEVLSRALTDRDWQVRQAAEDLLDDPPI